MKRHAERSDDGQRVGDQATQGSYFLASPQLPQRRSAGVARQLHVLQDDVDYPAKSTTPRPSGSTKQVDGVMVEHAQGLYIRNGEVLDEVVQGATTRSS